MSCRGELSLVQVVSPIVFKFSRLGTGVLVLLDLYQKFNGVVLSAVCDVSRIIQSLKAQRIIYPLETMCGVAALLPGPVHDACRDHLCGYQLMLLRCCLDPSILLISE